MFIWWGCLTMSNVINLLQLIYDFIYQLFITVIGYFPIGEAEIWFGNSTYTLQVLIASLMSIFVTLIFVLIPFTLVFYIIKILKGSVRK